MVLLALVTARGAMSTGMPLARTLLAWRRSLRVLRQSEQLSQVLSADAAKKHQIWRRKEGYEERRTVEGLLGKEVKSLRSPLGGRKEGCACE
jgi:hypothetical protein